MMVRLTWEGSSVEFKDLYVDGVAYTDALGFGTVAMTLPTADGSANQVLKTDGSGALSWASNTASTSIDGLSDAKSAGTNFTGSLIVGHQTTGTLDNAQYNTAVGLASLDAVTTGDNNVGIGYDALTDNTTGTSNVALGMRSLYNNTEGEKISQSGHQVYIQIQQETLMLHLDTIVYITIRQVVILP